MNELFDNYKKNKSNNTSLALRHMMTKGADGTELYDEVAKIYFSEKNMKRIQNMIKKEVLIKTNNNFRLDDDQDENDLLVVMRAIYLEYAKFLPNKIVRQVKELNNITVNYIIPNMITNIKQSYSYIKEINQPIRPIDRPVNVNNAGRKTLPSLTTTWGF